ncbi:MAG: tetratricopeptide repeat protein [Pseudomonadota bacterium]
MTSRRRCPIATYKRLPRGKDKSHDEFKDWTLHVMLWLRKHWTTAIEVVALCMVVFAVVVGASAYGQHKARSAAEKLYELEKSSPKTDEKIDQLESIADKYSRTFAGKYALMELGGLLLEEGNFQAAAKHFMMLADGSRNQPMFRIAALHRLADVQLAAGDPAEAAKTFRKAAADPHNELALYSELMAAACLERANDYDSAAKLYEMIIEDAGEYDVAVREVSEERLLWLYAKGYNAS